MNSASTTSSTADTVKARHPAGLRTLFFLEMWERFSYYGMRGLLVLFMTGAAAKSGLGIDDRTAKSIYALYGASVYLASLPGGWLADRLLGAQRAVWYGGIIIAAGHFTLALPYERTFFLGLVLIVFGTGLLKSNISAIVGGLYPEGGARRDAGFSIYYMGVNLGAFLGPFVCGTLGEKYNWHYGFAAAGVGMVLGLVQFDLSRGTLGEAGLHPGNRKPLPRAGWLAVGLVAMAVVLGLSLAFAGIVPINPVAIAGKAQGIIIAVAVIYFAGLFAFGRLDWVEKKRVMVIILLFCASALFWAGFEQAGSFFNLFAERHTLRGIDWPGWLGGRRSVVPASWFQAVNPVFVIVLAPLFAGLWVRLARRHLEPSIPIKFGFGLVFLAIGFLVMLGASVLVAAGHSVLPTWLLSIYLIHTFGELCLSPVGLSSVTKLAPPRFVGQMLGVWFVANSLGNLLAGKIAGDFDEAKLKSWPALCLPMILLPAAAGILLILLSRPIKRLMEGVE